jgi:hypothetical protein
MLNVISSPSYRTAQNSAYSSRRAQTKKAALVKAFGGSGISRSVVVDADFFALRP